jgi:hypothetical protein
MTRFLSTSLLLAALLPGLTGCGGSKPTAGGNVAMRDMDVVDGTANDSMADLDNATDDGTLLSNTPVLPAQGTHGAPVGNSADTNTSTAETGGNASAAQ